jgi:PKD repeat protein
MGTSFSTSATEGEIPLDVTVTDTSTPVAAGEVIDRWEWDFGDGTSKNTNVGPHTKRYESAGTYEIVLIAWGSAAYADLDTQYVGNLAGLAIARPAFKQARTSTVVITANQEHLETDEGSGHKWLKIATPDYSGDPGVQQSYLRMGSVPERHGTAGEPETVKERGAWSGGSEKAATIQETNRGNDESWDSSLNNVGRDGYYSFTDGNRLEITERSREVVIGGGNRFTINGGGLGAWDAEPVFGSWFRKTDVGWRSTTWGVERSDSYKFGDSENYFGGFTFSGFFGLSTSITIGGDISLSAAVSLSAYAGLSISMGESLAIDVTDDTKYTIAESMKSRVSDEILLQVNPAAGADIAASTRVCALIAAVGGGMALAGSMVQASNLHNDADGHTGAGAPVAQAGGVLALASVLVAAGIVAYKAYNDSPTDVTRKSFMHLESSGEATLGNENGEVYIDPDGTIYLGSDTGAKLEIDPNASTVKTVGGNYTFNFNSGALTINP